MSQRPRSSMRRSSAAFVLLLLTLTIHPLAAQRPAPAQRGGAPKPDTPQLVVSVLASSDPAVGIAAADAIRERIQSEHSATDLYVVPRPQIDKILKESGFDPDSALGESELMSLARQARGDYALAGTVERTAKGVRTLVRLLTRSGPRIVEEPLPPIVGADIGDIAKQVDRAVADALRALTFYRDCQRALLTGDYRQAAAAAQQGLRLRPASAALNSCQLSILEATHASPDSIIAVASAITAIDSANVAAWANLVDAYDQRKDSVRALDATRRLHSIDAANVTVTLSLVDRLVGAGQPEPALAVLDTALRDAPSSADLLRKRWLLQLRVGQYAQALATGNALVAADTTAATEVFYQRQFLAAAGARDSASSHRIALQAIARFPNNVDFLLVVARDTLDRGAPRDGLVLVNRVLVIDPANAAAWQLAIAAHASANGADSAVATARRALSAGVKPEAVGGSLLAVVAPVLDKARASSSRADWEAVLHAAQAVDSVAPSPRSAYYIGAAAFQIANDEIQSLSANHPTRTPAERQATCASATQLEDLIRTVTIAMPKGGSVDPAVATQILGALPGYTEFVSSVKQASCRRD